MTTLATESPATGSRTQWQPVAAPAAAPDSSKFDDDIINGTASMAKSWNNLYENPEKDRINGLNLTPEGDFSETHIKLPHERVPDRLKDTTARLARTTDISALNQEMTALPPADKLLVYNALYNSHKDYERERTNYHMKVGTASDYAPAAETLQKTAATEVKNNPQNPLTTGLEQGYHAFTNTTNFARQQFMQGKGEDEMRGTREARRAYDAARAGENPIAAGVGSTIGSMASPESLAAMAATGGIINPLEAGIAEDLAGAGIRAGVARAAAAGATALPKAAGYMGLPQTAQQIASGQEATPIANTLKAAPLVVGGELGGALADKVIGGLRTAWQPVAKVATGAAVGAGVNVGGGIINRGGLPTGQELAQEAVSGAVVGGLTSSPGDTPGARQARGFQEEFGVDRRAANRLVDAANSGAAGRTEWQPINPPERAASPAVAPQPAEAPPPAPVMNESQTQGVRNGQETPPTARVQEAPAEGARTAVPRQGQQTNAEEVLKPAPAQADNAAVEPPIKLTKDASVEWDGKRGSVWGYDDGKTVQVIGPDNKLTTVDRSKVKMLTAESMGLKTGDAVDVPGMQGTFTYRATDANGRFQLLESDTGRMMTSDPHRVSPVERKPTSSPETPDNSKSAPADHIGNAAVAKTPKVKVDDIPAVGTLGQALEGKKVAWAKVQQVRAAILENYLKPMDRRNPNLQLDMIKALDAHRQYQAMEAGARKAIANRAAELAPTEHPKPLETSTPRSLNETPALGQVGASEASPKSEGVAQGTKAETATQAPRSKSPKSRSASELLLEHGRTEGRYPNDLEKGSENAPAIHPDAAKGLATGNRSNLRNNVREDQASNQTAAMNAEQIARHERTTIARFGATKSENLADAITHYKNDPDPAVRMLAVQAEAEGTGPTQKVKPSTFNAGDKFKIGDRPFRVEIDADGNMHFVDDDVTIPYVDPNKPVSIKAGSHEEAGEPEVPEGDFAPDPAKKTTGAQGSLLGERYEGSDIGSKTGSMFGDMGQGAKSGLEAEVQWQAAEAKANTDRDQTGFFGPGAAATTDPTFRVIAGDHAPVPEDAPRIMKAVASAPADASRKATIGGRILQGLADTYETKSKAVKEAITATKDELARYGQKAFPGLNRESPKASLAGSALTAIPEYKASQLDEWQSHLKAIAKTHGMPLEDFRKLVGSALTEDNLRGVRDGILREVEEAKAELKKAGTPEASDAIYKEITKLEAQAKQVKTVLGADDSPLQTEADYTKAMENPAVQEAAAYFRQFIEPTLTDLYKSSSKWNAADDEGNPIEPPVRGKDFGLHLSLNPIIAGEEPATGGKLRAGGNIRNTLEKHSILERKATGAAASYELDLFKNLDNALSKSILPGTHAKFYQELVNAGVAVEGPRGPAPEIGGKPSVGFDLRFKPGAKLYVRSDLAAEVRHALNIDKADRPLSTVGNFATRLQLASGVDAMSHIANQLPNLLMKPTAGGAVAEAATRLSPGLGKAVRVAENLPVLKLAGILDAVLTKGYRVAFGDLQTKAQITELSRIGALQSPHEGSNYNPLNWIQIALTPIVKSMRLALDDGFKAAVDANIGIKDTPANRRDYVNQAGNYHKESSATLVRWLKSSGVGPFATAGSARVAQGVRTLAGFAPGAEGSVKARTLLRINAAAQVAGLLSGVAMLNYLRTGKMQPAGTPVGSIYLGQDDEGKPHYYDVADLFGARGAARTVGLDAAMKPGATGDKIAKQAISNATGPAMGPLVTFGLETAAGINPHGWSRMGEGTGPGNIGANTKEALRQANPTIENITSQREGGGLASQLGKFAPRVGQSEQDITKAERPEVLKRIVASYRQSKNPLDAIRTDEASGKLSRDDAQFAKEHALYHDDDVKSLVSGKLEEVIAKLEKMNQSDRNAPAKRSGRDPAQFDSVLQVVQDRAVKAVTQAKTDKEKADARTLVRRINALKK